MKQVAIALLHSRPFTLLLSALCAMSAFSSTVAAEDAFLVPRQNVLTEIQRPFLFYGEPVPRDSGAWREDYGRSILKYDSAIDCIEAGDPDSPTVDLSRVNWRRIKGRNAFDVCAFRIVTSLASRDDVIAWLHNQGFEISASTREGNRISDLNGRDVYILFGKWTLEQYRERKPSLLSSLGIELIQRVGLTIAYAESGEISAVIFAESTK